MTAVLIGAVVSAVLAAQDASPPAATPDHDARSAPLEDVFPFWTDFQALEQDERSRFELSYVLSAPLRGDGTDYNFWVQTGANAYALLDASAPVIPPDVNSFEAGYRLFTDAPRGAVQVQMTLRLPGEGRTEYSAQDLESALAQANSAMRRSMGIRVSSPC